MSRSALHVHAGGPRASPGEPTENGAREEEEEGDLDDEVDASHLERFMRDRRRAQSLPAGLLDGVPGGHERKRVKFADSMGLNLESVKTFSALEEPQIPTKVLSRHRSFPPQDPLRGPLRDLRGLDPDRLVPSLDPDRLVPCFPEPRDVERRVQRLRVCLERVSVSRFDVRGHIRVLAGGADREVGVRYTFNDWLSHMDAQALPAGPPGAAGGPGQRFGFTVYTPPFMGPGAEVHLAVYLRSAEGEFWDNNEGRNYTLRYHCASAPVSSAAFCAT